MSYTHDFYWEIRYFRKELNDINEEYAERLESLDKYKGSAGYEDECAKLETERKAAVKAAQDKARERLNAICDDMEKTLISRPLKAPTSEQLNILTLFKMREDIPLEEVKAAEKVLEDCPAALSALEEMARKTHPSYTSSKPSAAAYRQAIAALKESVSKITAIEKPNSRREYVSRSLTHSPDYDGGESLKLYRFDVDYKTESDCITDLAGVNYDDFTAAVNI